MEDHEETSLSPKDEESLWAELESCISKTCDNHEAIDDTLRTWLDLTSKLRERSSDSSDAVVSSAQSLLASHLYQENKDYVRTQIIFSLIQEDETGKLHAISCLLLLDGHHDEAVFPRMIGESCFPRLLELLNGRRDDDPRLHRFLLHLMYEMSRMWRLDIEDLASVGDDFVHYLFQIIEGLSDDVHDPYHYPTIRVLLVLNEQYMLASTDTGDPKNPTGPLTNRIVKCLSYNGASFRTFGENIILLLNRETETSLQLLILKLLYLLFTNKATYEYFYTNDLRVLLDVIIRNLMDLPDEKMSLRHTYLRVLYPLLAHTQLSQPPHYKCDEVLRLLDVLRGSHNFHFAPADETTLRLVARVAKVKWIEKEELAHSPPGGSDVARKILGMSLPQQHSTVSVNDIAEVTEKPGVQTPSRSKGTAEAEVEGGVEGGKEAIAVVKRAKKPLPAVPAHRHGTPFTSVSTTTVPVNGAVKPAAKKIPPKAPPPRRQGKMRMVEHPPPEPIQEPSSH